MHRVSKFHGVMLFLLLVFVPSRAWAEVKVVATLPGLAAIAAEVGGEHVEVEALVPSGVDPHFVDPRPNLVLTLNQAELLIVNGLELEVGWLPKLITNARNARIAVGSTGHLDASQFVELLEVPPARVDRSQGDVHPGGNPHFIHDPRRAISLAEAIALRLAEIDPEHAEAYQKNAIRFITEAKKFVESEAQRFAALTPARRRVVVYHRSLVYLLDWLQLERVATLEPRPGIPPNPGHVAKVLKRMKATETRIILQETYYPRTASDKLASLAHATVVVIHAAPDFKSGERYLTSLRRMVDEIHKVARD